jgi:phosphotransferase system enzyme I (PtsI)
LDVDDPVAVGIGVSPGVARGQVARMSEPAAADGNAPARSPSDEVALAHAAIAAVAAQLRTIAASTDDQTAREVLEAQAMIAEDPTIADAVSRRIFEGATAAAAFTTTFAAHRAQLAGARDRVRERTADLDDISDRLVTACLGAAMPQLPDTSEPYVLVAHSLSPADTASLPLDRVQAIVTVEGGPTSHTAILARALGIPAVVGCAEAGQLRRGEWVSVDGTAGVVSRLAVQSDRNGRLAQPRVETPPRRGRAGSHAVALLANVGSVEDAAQAAAAGAEGIGLLRTEFLYLNSHSAPSVAVQETAFGAIFRHFADRLVVVRLLDGGGDKRLPYLSAEHGQNPALGIRGLRALRANSEILDDQLEAVTRAARDSASRVAVMAPMVTDARDAAWFSDRVRAHPRWPREITVGVMVETPAAAMTAREVLSVCDFASIGTNDLIQYVLAADRSVAALSALHDPWHPAVLELVARTAAAGVQAGKPVGVCGEAAGDPVFALVLAGLGVTSLSMSPSALAAVRDALAHHPVDTCKKLAHTALLARSAAQARADVLALMS